MSGALELQSLEPLLDVGGRELEMIGRHMAVGACPPVAAQAVELSVGKRAEAARDAGAGLAATGVTVTVSLGAELGVRRQERQVGGAGGDHQRRKEHEPAGDQQ